MNVTAEQETMHAFRGVSSIFVNHVNVHLDWSTLFSRSTLFQKKPHAGDPLNIRNELRCTSRSYLVKGFFQLEIIIHVSVVSSLFI